MALSVRKIFDRVKNKYRLSLLAGSLGLSRTVSWVYYSEDSSTVDYIRGGEIAITLGVFLERYGDNVCDDEEHLLNFLESFIENFTRHGGAALIVNVGKYIKKIPDRIIELCNEKSLPLFSMPWEVHTIDVMQEVGNMIASDRLNEQTLENLLFDGIFSPEKFDKNKLLDTKFADGCQFAVFLQKIELERFSFELEQAERYVSFFFNPKLNIPESCYASFIHNGNLIYVLKDNVYFSAREIAGITGSDRYFFGLKNSLSDICDDLNFLPDMYSHAVYAMEFSDGKNQPALYENLGVRKILAEVKNKKVLEQFCRETLSGLDSFSPEKRADYRKTLELYLKYSGNIQKIGEENFIHRNTIVYRLKKIQEVLKVDLSDGDVCCALRLALFIQEMSGVNMLNFRL